MSQYEVRVSLVAREKLLTLPETSFKKVRKLISTLREMPYGGSVYDPVYEAARPPFECRVAYAGKYGLYYTVHDEEALIYLRFVEDQTMDPRLRFKGR